MDINPTSRRIELPVFHTVLTLAPDGSGTITSDLDADPLTHPLTGFVLACACAGIDVETPAFLEALETTVDALANAADTVPVDDAETDEVPTGLHAFTIFCVSQADHPTTHIACHHAHNEHEAAEMAKAQTAKDWDESIENIRVRGIAKGDVTILDWTDDWEFTAKD